MWSGSGRRSLEGRRANGLPSRLVSCRALVSGGSARVAGCRLSRSRRCRGAICRSPSGRRSRSCSRVVVGCERSRVSSVAHHQRSPGSCSEMLRCGPVGLSIEPRPPKLMPTVARDDRSRRSLLSTWSCGAMCRTGYPGLCGGPMGASRARWSAGVGGVTDREKTAAGERRGVRSRSPVGCVFDFPDDESMRVSHESIYQSLVCAGPRSAAPGADRLPADRSGVAGSQEQDIEGQPELRDR